MLVLVIFLPNAKELYDSLPSNIFHPENPFRVLSRDSRLVFLILSQGYLMLNMFRQICGCTLSCETVTRNIRLFDVKLQQPRIFPRGIRARMLRVGIKEYDHPREIIVDLSRSIYREIHNLFNPERWQRSDSGSAGEIRERLCSKG